MDFIAERILSGNSTLNVLKLVRILRLARLLKLFRLSRLTRFFARVRGPVDARLAVAGSVAVTVLPSCMLCV